MAGLWKLRSMIADEPIGNEKIFGEIDGPNWGHINITLYVLDHVNHWHTRIMWNYKPPHKKTFNEVREQLSMKIPI